MKKFGLYLAWLIALVGMFIALYASDVLGWAVCNLCWYQRICLFPLALILGIACFRNDRAIAIYTVPMTVIGALFAAYQYLEQMIPGFAPIGLCGLGPSCSDAHFKLLGFITFPLISLITFIVLTILLVRAK